MKKLIYSFPVVGVILGYAQSAYATSTEMITLPPIGDWINGIWEVSTPLFTSLKTPIFWCLGIILVGYIISLIIGGLRK